MPAGLCTRGARRHIGHDRLHAERRFLWITRNGTRALSLSPRQARSPAPSGPDLGRSAFGLGRPRSRPDVLRSRCIVDLPNKFGGAERDRTADLVNAIHASSSFRHMFPLIYNRKLPISHTWSYIGERQVRDSAGVKDRLVIRSAMELDGARPWLFSIAMHGP